MMKNLLFALIFSLFTSTSAGAQVVGSSTIIDLVPSNALDLTHEQFCNLLQLEINYQSDLFYETFSIYFESSADTGYVIGELKSIVSQIEQLQLIGLQTGCWLK